MKRTTDQNAILHCWCREIALHLRENNVNCSEKMVKEMVKVLLGNGSRLLTVDIAMPTSSYKRADADLTQAEHDDGVLSMEAFLTKIQVWAATDLNLVLESPNENEE